MYRLGRSLQLIGMAVLPVTMAGQIMGVISVARMLTLCLLAMLVFLVGQALSKNGPSL